MHVLELPISVVVLLFIIRVMLLLGRNKLKASTHWCVDGLKYNHWYYIVEITSLTLFIQMWKENMIIKITNFSGRDNN